MMLPAAIDPDTAMAPAQVSYLRCQAAVAHASDAGTRTG
jgi:hypothetical protein